MNTIIVVSYLIISFEIFATCLRMLKYQHQKRELDKIKYEMISNMILVKNLCTIIGYNIKRSVSYLTFPEDMVEFLNEVSTTMKSVNNSSKAYKREAYDIYDRIREKHKTLLSEYNSKCNMINSTLNKWPTPFKSMKPSYEEMLDESLTLY